MYKKLIKNYKVWWKWDWKTQISAAKKKKQIPIYAVDINKTIVSNKVSFDNKGFKYFIGCKAN